MDQSKKLYFKQSATEALHSAILLKARNPSGENTNNNASSTINGATTTTTSIMSTNTGQSECAASKTASAPSSSSKMPLCPKLANANTLLTISSSMANSAQILSNLNFNIDLMNYNFDSANTNNSQQQSQQQQQQTNENNRDRDMDELDSPFKIKENILASIRNLKPVLVGLDPLRSSTSDDEDSHTDNVERKFKHSYLKALNDQMEHSSHNNNNSNDSACAHEGNDQSSEVVLLKSTDCRLG